MYINRLWEFCSSFCDNWWTWFPLKTVLQWQIGNCGETFMCRLHHSINIFTWEKQRERTILLYRLTALFKMKISLTYFQALDIAHKKQSIGCFGPNAIYSYDTHNSSLGLNILWSREWATRLGKILDVPHKQPCNSNAHFWNHLYIALMTLKPSKLDLLLRISHFLNLRASGRHYSLFITSKRFIEQANYGTSTNMSLDVRQ